jgi:protein PhnA
LRAIIEDAFSPAWKPSLTQLPAASRRPLTGCNAGSFADTLARCNHPLNEAMSKIPACPKCAMENTYPDGDNFVCADCGHEWPAAQSAAVDESGDAAIRDANGNVLADGDAVVLIKDLKVKGSSITLKMGTKVKSIRLVGGDHEVDCKMDGGSFMLKACYLRKA